MKRSRTGSLVEKARTVPPVVSVQMPLPLVDVLADMKTSFFGLCLTAGQQVFRAMMDDERAFWFLGPATYVGHEGERPMSITWRLEHALPGDLFASFAAAVA